MKYYTQFVFTTGEEFGGVIDMPPNSEDLPLQQVQEILSDYFELDDDFIVLKQFHRVHWCQGDRDVAFLFSSEYKYKYDRMIDYWVGIVDVGSTPTISTNLI